MARSGRAWDNEGVGLKYRVLPVLVGAGVLCLAQSAYAATLTVDDDKADCPAAGVHVGAGGDRRRRAG